MPRIEGASPEQRAILERILAGLPSTQMRVLRVKPEYDLEPERDEHDNPPPDWDPTAPLGDALRLVDPEWPDARTEWELELVGAAFHRASAQAGLTNVVAVLSQRGGPYFWGDDVRADATVASRDQEHARIESAAATTRAVLERIEFLEAGGLAVAVILTVSEPHSFLRQWLDAFVDLSGHLDHARAGSYVEVRDYHPDPVSVFARAISGMSGHRADVTCCVAPGLSRPFEAPPPPPCPVFGQAVWR